MKGDLPWKDFAVRNQARENFKDLKGLRVFEVHMPAGMARYWTGFWEERTEAKLVVWEDPAKASPYYGIDGVVCIYSSHILM